MWWEYLSIFLFTTTKWLIGVVFVLGGNRGFWESMAWCVGGGMTGVLLYTYLGYLLFRLWRRLHPVSEGFVRFNKLKRTIVRVRRSRGLAGIALLTPVLLTVPVGTAAANLVEPRKLRVIGYMFCSFLLWSALLCGLESWVQLDIFEWLRRHFGRA